MNHLSKCQLVAIFMLLGAATNACADTPPADPTYHVIYGVDDWRGLVWSNSANYKNYRLIVLGDQTLSADEKAARIGGKVKEIERDIRAERTGVYDKKYLIARVGNSATKGGAGGSPKVVDAKCVGAPGPQMYTKPEWARGAYKSGDDDAGDNILVTGTAIGGHELVTPDGGSVCAIGLKQSGKGRKVSYSEAKFHILPGHIKTIVDAEVNAMMYAIVNTPV